MIRSTSAASVFPCTEQYRTLQALSDALGRLALASRARAAGCARGTRAGRPAGAIASAVRWDADARRLRAPD